MRRSPRHRRRIDAAKTKLPEIKLIDEKVNHPDRVIFGGIVFQLSWKHCSLAAVAH
jgi:hypothetical protein